jgi:tetratricopeptide (TPR) repeat protein
MFIDTQNTRTVAGVRLVRLTGDKKERALQHGRLIASLTPEEKQSLAVHPLAMKNQSLIRRTFGGTFGDSFGSLGGKFYQSYVFRLFKKLPKELREPLKIFAQASGIKFTDCILALYQPDMLMVLAGLTSEKAKNTFLSGMPGCSTAVYLEPPKNTGKEDTPAQKLKAHKMLFMRNLDYPAAAAWEKWPTVFYHEPSGENAHRYISIASLGVPLAGLTGWNDCGIGFSLHAHFSKHVSPSETPIFFLGEEILEKAESLEEAIFICKNFKTIGSWALNLVSFNENKAASVELVNGKFSVREMADCLLAHANGFQNTEFRESELYFNGAFFEDVTSRKKMLEQHFEKFSGDLTQGKNLLHAGLNAISSHVDAMTGETRIFGNTVSLVTTIQSVIAKPDENAFYISTRNETPTPLGPFVKLPFRWDEIAHQENHPELISPTTPHSEAFLRATHLYHEAYVSWHVKPYDANTADFTLALLIEATETLPNDPHLWIQRGYFELLHDQRKSALDCFQTALTFKLSPHLRQVAQYFKAASLDLLGNRKDALILYEQILKSEDFAAGTTRPDPPLQKRAQKRLKKPYQSSYCQKITPDLQFVEPIYYL